MVARKSKIINENEQLLQGIKVRQASLNRLSTYLSELESQLSLIFAASPDVIVFLDEGHRIVRISDAVSTVLGYTKEEMLDRPVWDFIYFRDIEVTRDRFLDVYNKKLIYFNGDTPFINHWISKSGKLVKLIWRFSLCDEREKYTIGVATDITHLGANEFYNFKLLQKAIDLSSDGAIIIDNAQNNYSLAYVNKAYEKMTGYSSPELLGKSFLFLQTEENKQSRTLKTLTKCLEEGKGCDVLLQFKRKSGEVFYNRLAISAVIEHGTIVNYVGIVRDITEKIGVKYDWTPNAESGFVHLSKMP